MPQAVADHLAEMEALPVALEANGFFRSMLREISGVLESVVGIEEASGFVGLVGASIGEQIDREYRLALEVRKLTRPQVAAVLVDLKRRIDGNFYVIAQDEEKIVLGSRRCPFGDKVIGRPSLCMMTSNVFGRIAAQSLGYARVELAETIAEGARECRIVINLTFDVQDDEPAGIEYFELPET